MSNDHDAPVGNVETSERIVTVDTGELPTRHTKRERSAATSIVSTVALALVATASLVGCGSDAPPGAAEPATAPVVAATPAGTTHRVGAGPEGIVYDARTNTLAVAVRNPSRLLLLDPATLLPRRIVALPGEVRHLQLARPGGPVLVPAESAGELIEVALPEGGMRATKVGKQPHDAAGVAGGRVVVGNEFGKSISFLADGRAPQTVSGPKQPGGIIGDGKTVAVVDVGKFTLSTFDVDTRKQLALVKAGTGPTHGVLIPGNRAAVSDTRGNAILIFTLDPLKQVGSLALRGTPYGLAVDGSTVWVTLTARNQVVGLDVSGRTPKVIARYPTVRQPNTVAVEPGSHRIWITGTHDGVVQAIDR